jgi:hypothetical protein
MEDCTMEAPIAAGTTQRKRDVGKAAIVWAGVCEEGVGATVDA